MRRKLYQCLLHPGILPIPRISYQSSLWNRDRNMYLPKLSKLNDDPQFYFSTYMYIYLGGYFFDIPMIFYDFKYSLI